MIVRTASAFRFKGLRHRLLEDIFRFEFLTQVTAKAAAYVGLERASGAADQGLPGSVVSFAGTLQQLERVVINRHGGAHSILDGNVAIQNEREIPEKKEESP